MNKKAPKDKIKKCTLIHTQTCARASPALFQIYFESLICHFKFRTKIMMEHLAKKV